MKTRLLIVIGIGVVASGSITYLYAQMYDCLNPPIWMKGPPTGFDRCWKLFLNGHLPDYSDDRDRYENKQFQDIMKKKATLAFNILLDEYRYSVDALTVKDGYRTSDDHEFYMGYTTTTNGTSYFMMTMFESEQPIDTIDVQIFKIISDECTVHNILNSSGCDPKHLTGAVKDMSQEMWIGLDNED